MLVRLKQIGERWEVIALSGEYYNRTIASADTVVLRSARLHRGSITGYVVSMSGIQLANFVMNAGVIEFLFRSKFYKAPKTQAVLCEETDLWHDLDTGEQLDHQVRTVMVIGSDVFVEKLKEKKKVDEADYLELPVEKEPEVADGFLKKLFNKFKEVFYV